ncbi:hypothetical protein OHT52_12835 [Streptomyces sp. NBC_00247]|uniref:hypothetical protein n=1 Tax=Streptomyces sp. NBC_00247 TaxID=2975689 RepID=UPI002E2B4C66|nr:hypothetical protein [Streptomyces sp. NBC_00247]
MSTYADPIGEPASVLERMALREARTLLMLTATVPRIHLLVDRCAVCGADEAATREYLAVSPFGDLEIALPGPPVPGPRTTLTMLACERVSVSMLMVIGSVNERFGARNHDFVSRAAAAAREAAHRGAEALAPEVIEALDRCERWFDALPARDVRATDVPAPTGRLVLPVSASLSEADPLALNVSRDPGTWAGSWEDYRSAAVTRWVTPHRVGGSHEADGRAYDRCRTAYADMVLRRATTSFPAGPRVAAEIDLVALQHPRPTSGGIAVLP